MPTIVAIYGLQLRHKASAWCHCMAWIDLESGGGLSASTMIDQGLCFRFMKPILPNHRTTPLKPKDLGSGIKRPHGLNFQNIFNREKKKKNNAHRKPAYYRLRWHLNELEQPTCVRKTQHFQHGTVPSPCRRKLHWVKRGIEVNRQTGSSGGLTDASTLSSRCLNRWNS